MNSILIDFPESFESEWLTIRAPRPGDGAEINAAICEIFEDLKVWMPWARKIPILEESEVFARCKQCEFLLRQDLLLFSVSKGQIPWLAVVAYIGLTGIFRNLRLATGAGSTFKNKAILPSSQQQSRSSRLKCLGQDESKFVVIHKT